MPWLLIAAACLGTFAVTASGSTRAPFLLDMARDLDVPLGQIANLFGYTSVAWGLASFLAGTGSDRFGRRAFVVGGPVALSVAQLFAADSDGYNWLVFWVVMAGGCSGVFTGVSLAEVSTRVEDGQRSRAMGWVMSGQSLTLLLGIPLAAWIGASIGWRGVHVAVAVLAIAAAAAMAFTTRQPKAETNPVTTPASPKREKAPFSAAFTPTVVLLMASVVAERVCFAMASIYYATFLQVAHHQTLAAVAIPLAVYALGNITGTFAGGILGDRVRDRRRLYAFAMFISAALAALLFGWQISLPLTVALGFAYAFANALSRPPLMALIADVPVEIRGTVMGLNSTFASLGWLLAATIGGFVMANFDFIGFSPVLAVLAVVAGLLGLIAPRR